MAERKRLNEQELFFYEDRVCGEADLVYRFCLVLTLNPESAQKLLLTTFKDVADNLRAVLGSSTNKLRTTLLKSSFAQFSESSKKGPPGSSPLVKFLSSLPVDVRAALFSIDVAGLSSEEASAIVGGNDASLRKMLATGRKALVLDKNFGS